jgi:hypothetical protein
VFELLIVLGVVGGLGGVTAVVTLTPVPALVTGAIWMIGIGFAFGTPTGFAYHVALYRALKPRNALPRLWWLRPNRHHDALKPAERPRVLFWFTLGAIGYLVIVVGCVLLAGAALRGV